mgnify:CR=1 FL=1
MSGRQSAAKNDLADAPAYRKAYEDVDFLRRDDLRSVRLQLELLKPELLQREQHVRSTVVVFGSARTPAPETAEAELSAALREVEAHPDCPQAQAALRRAKIRCRHAGYYEAAREFARLVSRQCQNDERCEYVVVTGGGPGIMEAANRGAADVGAKSIGLNITLPYEQMPNPYITPELCFNFHYFAIRKMHFLLRAKALVVFPGGFGTLDELFETLTLVQTHKMPRIPIVMYAREYWDRIVNIENMVSEGVIDQADLELFHYAETPEEAWRRIAASNGLT